MGGALSVHFCPLILRVYCQGHLSNSKQDRTQIGLLPLQLPLTEGGEVGQGRQGPSEIPLCVGLESFCLCELYIKQSWAAVGSLKWQRGVSELSTGPLPRHVPVQNGLSSSVKTAQLKVYWEWHKIKAKDQYFSCHSCHIMEHVYTHYSVILLIGIEVPSLTTVHFCFCCVFLLFENYLGFDVFQSKDNQKSKHSMSTIFCWYSSRFTASIYITVRQLVKCQ